MINSLIKPISIPSYNEAKVGPIFEAAFRVGITIDREAGIYLGIPLRSGLHTLKLSKKKA